MGHLQISVTRNEKDWETPVSATLCCIRRDPEFLYIGICSRITLYMKAVYKIKFRSFHIVLLLGNAFKIYRVDYPTVT